MKLGLEREQAVNCRWMPTQSKDAMWTLLARLLPLVLAAAALSPPDRMRTNYAAPLA